MLVEIIVSNRCMCKCCGDVIESGYLDDFNVCCCGSIYVDGGKGCLKRGGDLSMLLDLSETYKIDYKV